MGHWRALAGIGAAIVVFGAGGAWAAGRPELQPGERAVRLTPLQTVLIGCANGSDQEALISTGVRGLRGAATYTAEDAAAERGAGVTAWPDQSRPTPPGVIEEQVQRRMALQGWWLDADHRSRVFLDEQAFVLVRREAGSPGRPDRGLMVRNCQASGPVADPRGLLAFALDVLSEQQQSEWRLFTFDRGSGVGIEFGPADPERPHVRLIMGLRAPVSAFGSLDWGGPEDELRVVLTDVAGRQSPATPGAIRVTRAALMAGLSSDAEMILDGYSQIREMTPAELSTFESRAR